MQAPGENRPLRLGNEASWKVAILTEADRLESELNVALGATSDAATAARGATVRDHIAQVRALATGTTAPSGRLGRVADWWSGASIELAWQSLHLAQEELVTLQDATTLHSQTPHLRSLASATFGGERARQEAKLLDGWDHGPPDSLVARRILAAAHARSDAQHQNVRLLRNTLYALFAIVTAIDVALWATGVAAGAVVGLGALGGAVSVVFALRASTPAGPYNTLPPQTLLKIAGGAATAIMAVKILDFANASAAISASRDEFYAVIFGFSQQAFTRLVDQRADDLTKTTPPRAARAVAAGPSAGGITP